MSRFCHLIFDLDGTLVDTQADLAVAANYMLEQLDLPPRSVQQVGSYIGHGARVLVERVLGSGQAHQTAHGFDLFMRYYAEHLVDQSVVYPGIDQVLAAAQAQGMVLSVLTNKPEAPSRGIMSGLGLMPFFGRLVGGDTLPTKKPNPYGVAYLQRLTGVSLPETLLIGDSSIDMETGQRASIATCGVRWGFSPEGLSHYAPEFIVDSAEELLAVILD
jgi:phosphoglycolate phosphatase